MCSEHHLLVQVVDGLAHEYHQTMKEGTECTGNIFC
jgi:hypothetical protein